MKGVVNRGKPLSFPRFLEHPYLDSACWTGKACLTFASVPGFLCKAPTLYECTQTARQPSSLSLAACRPERRVELEPALREHHELPTPALSDAILRASAPWIQLPIPATSRRSVRLSPPPHSLPDKRLLPAGTTASPKASTLRRRCGDCPRLPTVRWLLPNRFHLPPSPMPRRLTCCRQTRRHRDEPDTRKQYPGPRRQRAGARSIPRKSWPRTPPLAGARFRPRSTPLTQACAPTPTFVHCPSTSPRRRLLR